MSMTGEDNLSFEEASEFVLSASNAAGMELLLELFKELLQANEVLIMELRILASRVAALESSGYGMKVYKEKIYEFGNPNPYRISYNDNTIRMLNKIDSTIEQLKNVQTEET